MDRFYLDGGGGGSGGGTGQFSLRGGVELCTQPFNLLEGSLILNGCGKMLEDELPPRREYPVNGESLCTRPLSVILGQAHLQDLFEIVRDGPPGVV